MSFVIAPQNLVRGENNYKPWEDAMRALEARAFKRAAEIWEGFTPGGVSPGDRQFGVCPIRQNEMAHDVTSTTLSGSYTFRKNIAATGWRNMFDYTVRKDVMHAFAGFAVSDEVLRILQIRAEISDKILPIIDIQEAQNFGSFALILKQDQGKEYIAEPESRVLIRAYFDTIGWQTFMPLGIQLYRRKDLVITET